MLSVQINNPAVAHLEKKPSFIVSSMDEARARVENARNSDDTLSEEEYKSDMEAFWKTV
ncbi:MAG: hypothetical protein JHC35_03390 [Sulfuricurvum sp.]|jgi:hypothetical protein|uniref:hypothetical protein n=1 Tax=Sulfuricurvum sp. TaxID=2025608 RepID=UPI0025EDA44E|nr:hypothetical protein [Sulfuricurvum sp.]MCI4406318.1 hypothetical protein [Sulfuricurvum sp.]